MYNLKTNMTNANEIKFRCSGLGAIMTDAKEKSNKEKFDEATVNLAKYKSEYASMNAETKTAQKKLLQIQKTNQLLIDLESVKDVVNLSETCKKELIKVYAKEKHSRYEELKNKYLDKGNEREPDATTLLSLTMKTMFRQNRVRLNNDFASGEPDLYEGESIYKAKKTLDTKCSWSLITFLEAKLDNLNSDYDWQGQGYMWLTGAEEHTVAYCLVNGTFKYLNDQIRSIGWKMGILDGDVSEDADYIKKIQQLERNHIFDINAFMKENPHYEAKNEVYFDGVRYSWEYDIPRDQRIHMKVFNRDEEKIERIKERVILCREYMNKEFFNQKLIQ